MLAEAADPAAASAEKVQANAARKVSTAEAKAPALADLAEKVPRQHTQAVGVKAAEAAEAAAAAKASVAEPITAPVKAPVEAQAKAALSSGGAPTTTAAAAGAAAAATASEATPEAQPTTAPVVATWRQGLLGALATKAAATVAAAAAARSVAEPEAQSTTAPVQAQPPKGKGRANVQTFDDGGDRVVRSDSDSDSGEGNPFSAGTSTGASSSTGVSSSTGSSYSSAASSSSSFGCGGAEMDECTTDDGEAADASDPETNKSQEYVGRIVLSAFPPTSSQKRGRRRHGSRGTHRGTPASFVEPYHGRLQVPRAAVAL